MTNAHEKAEERVIHNEEQLRLVCKFMEEIIKEILSLETNEEKWMVNVYQDVLDDLCKMIKPLENKLHLDKYMIAVDNHDLPAIQEEQEMIDFWRFEYIDKER